MTASARVSIFCLVLCFATVLCSEFSQADAQQMQCYARPSWCKTSLPGNVALYTECTNRLHYCPSMMLQGTPCKVLLPIAVWPIPDQDVHHSSGAWTMPVTGHVWNLVMYSFQSLWTAGNGQSNPCALSSRLIGQPAMNKPYNKAISLPLHNPRLSAAWNNALPSSNMVCCRD